MIYYEFNYVSNAGDALKDEAEQRIKKEVDAAKAKADFEVKKLQIRQKKMHRAKLKAS